MPDAFSAKIWINDIKVQTLRNCLVGTFGLTDITVNTFLCDFKCQIALLMKPELQCRQNLKHPHPDAQLP